MSPPPRGSRRRDELALEVLRARRQRKNRRKRVSRRRRVGILASAAGIVLAGLLLTVGFGGAIAYQKGCSLASLEPFSLGENTFIYASDGSRLGAIPAEGRNRQKVPWRRISPWVVKATVAIEDKRYWQHGGIDPIGITRAFWADLSQGKVVQGGSTITQQLVRNLYISRERTFTRKLREACLAVKLADKWSKQKILTAYLNQIYYGSQAYGVEAAAQTYFSKSARRLTLSQAALLAGLPQAPSKYDPFANPSAARARRKQVLHAMFTTGAITRRQYRHAVRNKSLHLEPGELYKKISQPYFFSYVRDELVRVYGEARVRHGGLRVYTTIDPRLQQEARKAIKDTLYLSNDPAAAVVAIDPATGAIRAMTAVSPGRANNQFNLIADARRQPGSTFKAFVLATAIEQGMNPESTYYLSAPLHCDTGPCRYKAWDPETYDRTYVGSSSVVNATLRSDNTVYARLTLDVGPDKVAEMARRLGVEMPPANYYYIPSLGLGSIAVTPLDMASAYATFAARGIYSKPMAITKVILARGQVDTKAGWGKPIQKQVISPGVAYEVTKILQENVISGTGIGANFGKPAAGKTGTTENHADAWFSGYTPDLETTVWMGYQQGEIPMTNVHGIAVAGGTFPATIWHLFMQQAVADKPARDFLLPNVYPTYKDWHGEWQYSGGTYVPTTPSYGGTTTATTTAQTTTAAAPPAKTQTKEKKKKPPPPPRRPRRRLPRRRRHLRRRAAWGALGAGLAAFGLTAAAVMLAWPHDSPLVPRHAGHPTGDRTWAWLFLGLLIAAFGAYVGGVVLTRSAPPRLAAVAAIACAVQLVPLGAPLLLSTDAWAYWDYGRIAAVHGANPYRVEPERFSRDPAFRSIGVAWRDSTTVYGPAFTLASEPLARAAGSSADAAAWIYKSLAAIAVLAAGALAARLSRRPALALAFVGWNPLLAVHFAGGGHNDAWLVLLVVGALAAGAAGRRQLAGVCWALSIFVKWVPLLLLPLRALEARAQRRKVGHAGFAVAAIVLAAAAFARFGTAWLHAFGPLARNANHETRWALPHRLQQLGVPHDAAIALFAAAFVAAYAWLAREAWRGRARLGLATVALLFAAPYLVVWYVVWALPLAAAEDDEPAALLSLVLCAYLLRQTIPI